MPTASNKINVKILLRVCYCFDIQPYPRNHETRLPSDINIGQSAVGFCQYYVNPVEIIFLY